jgi:hypothetical protein
MAKSTARAATSDHEPVLGEALAPQEGALHVLVVTFCLQKISQD